MSNMTLAQAHSAGYELVRKHSQRFVEYLDAITAEEVGCPVPGLAWTVGETVTHVQSIYERYTRDRRRADRPEALAEQNQADVERIGVDLAASAKSIHEQVELLSGIVEHVDPARLFPFHAGQQTTIAGGWGNLLGELLAHGDDLARATGRPFSLPGEDLEIIWRFTLPVLQGWIRPEVLDVEESWQLRFPSGAIRLVLDRGAVRWGLDEPQLDHHHELEVVDAAATTLQFPYRRRAINDPALALLASRFRDL